ncbi:hypothetical protein [Streptomyces sp. NPDC048445]|uniref:hypothetical protein n=1 Tax=Streptomyces sp. NPDC048445 TaxID=3365553 RepID=UPI00371E09D8
MTVKALPPVSALTEQQQRGWRCIWCDYPLAAGLDVDLGEQRARPQDGAAYSWFPRACADTELCASRATQAPA